MPLTLWASMKTLEIDRSARLNAFCSWNAFCFLPRFLRFFGAWQRRKIRFCRRDFERRTMNRGPLSVFRRHESEFGFEILKWATPGERFAENERAGPTSGAGPFQLFQFIQRILDCSYVSARSVFAAQSGNTTGRELRGPPAFEAWAWPVPSIMSRLELVAAS